MVLVIFLLLGCAEEDIEQGISMEESNVAGNIEEIEIPVFNESSFLTDHEWFQFFSSVELKGNLDDSLFTNPTIMDAIISGATQSGYLRISSTTVEGPPPRRDSIGSLSVYSLDRKLLVLYNIKLGKIDSKKTVWQLADYLYIEVGAKNPGVYSVVGSNELGIFDLDDPTFKSGEAVSVEKVVSISIDTSELSIRDNTDGSFKAYNEIP